MVKHLLVVAVMLAVAFLLSHSFTGKIIDEQPSVAKVVDGDTLKLSNGERVRLLNIDTPEKGQYYWREASQRMKELASNKTVKLEADKTNRDKYGRLLRYAYIDGAMANLIMVREGYARSYYIAPDDKYLDDISNAEAYAKSMNLGIWKYDNITGAFCVWVYDFKYDPAGHDEQNLNGEYVVFRNSCTKPVNLSGWKIVTARNYEFVFPNILIGAKSLLSVHSGTGKANSSDIYWNSTKVVWRNSGDTLLAYNSKNQLVLNYSY
jgi:micrococcal nuclease